MKELMLETADYPPDSTGAFIHDKVSHQSRIYCTISGYTIYEMRLELMFFKWVISLAELPLLTGEKVVGKVGKAFPTFI